MTSLLAASEFDPNGSYFSSVITALDTHKVRVQSTTSTSTLAHAFSLDKGHKLTSLSWGLSPNVDVQSKKKRRLSQSIKIENQVLSIGLNKGLVLIYSPTANEIVGRLENPNSALINDYHFSPLTNSGWSVDVNQNITEWDLILFKPKQNFKFNENINVIKVINYQNKPHLLLASHSVYILDINTKEVVKTFPGHISPIHTVIPIENDTYFVTAAHGDRFINLYSIDHPSTVVVTQSNVLSVSYITDHLSAVTEDGIVEVFNHPLVKNTSKRRGQQSKQSNHSIKLNRPNGTSIKIESSYLDHEFITITWLEDQSIPFFEKIKLEDLTENHIITKEIPAIQSKQHSIFGQDVAVAKRYHESSAVITSGDNLSQLDNNEVVDDDNDADEEDGPSLAEKLELLKVENTVPKKKQGRATTGSLAVVLTQALRSNDHALLETVLSTRDENVLKTTVQRLDTSLAVILLERLAERIARQTNRQAQLNIWVKWVMIVHGGYLINISNLSKSLSSLHSTLTRRANTLPRLMQLQSKLDVLYSQHELNQLNKEQAGEDYNDSDESDVEYIEELDDGNLIDDGEQDIYEDEEENGYISIDGSSEEEDSDDDEVNEENGDFGDDVEEEVGYSDEEINGAKVEESESEDEQAALRQRIAKLKAKQLKARKN